MLIRGTQLATDPTAVDVRIEDGRVNAIAGRLVPQAQEPVLEAHGGALLPGLRDHHLHLAALAASLDSVPCGPPAVTSEAALIAALHDDGPDAGVGTGTGTGTAASDWLRGIGYHESVAGEIDRAWLDRRGPDRPLRIQHRSGRLWILNSAALARLGPIAADAPLERHAGKPTGRLYDADDWLRTRLAGDRPSLSAASRLLASRGVTALTEVTPRNGPEDYEFFAASQTKGELLQDALVMGDAQLDGVAPREHLGRGATKVHLHESALPDFERLLGTIARSHAARRPVAIHCATLAELAVALEAFGTAGTLAGDRIEHASVTPDGLLARIGELGLVVVTQPNFIWERGDQYLRDITPEQWPWLYRGRAFLDAGIGLAAGTDAPFGLPDPWRAMQAAVDRRTAAGAVLGQSEGLSPEAALGLFTGEPGDPARPAPALQPGVRADLCLIDRPWAAVRTGLASTRVVATFRGGTLIWRAT